MTSGTSAPETGPAVRPIVASRTLLACGAAAGPVYIAVSVVQAVLRDGFDVTRHPASMLSLGDLGWIQIVNFVVTGLLFAAAAVGMRRVLRAGPGHTWGPALVAVTGAGMVGGGVFVADAAYGFPPGTPAGPPEVMSWHGTVHMAVAGIAFLALIVAAFVFARRFAGQARPGWAAYSVASGAVFAVAFAALMSSPDVGWLNVLAALAILNGLAWLSAVAAMLRANALSA